MIIDIIYFILLLLAAFKGYSKGFIVAVFSFFAINIGLAAALKLSVVVAEWLGAHTGIGTKLLPIVAFALVMTGVALLVRFCALLIQKALQMAMLGLANRLAGIALYAVLYTILYSVVLFFADKIQLIKPDTIAASYCYNFVQPWGPKAIDLFGNLIPVFQNIFQALEHFFDKVAKKETSAIILPAKQLF